MKYANIIVLNILMCLSSVAMEYKDGGIIWGYEVDEGNATITWHRAEEEVKSVIIPAGVTTIGNSAFYNCINLSKLYSKANRV